MNEEPDTRTGIDTDPVAQMIEGAKDAKTEQDLLLKIATAATNYTRSIIPRIRVFGNDNDN